MSRGDWAYLLTLVFVAAASFGTLVGVNALGDWWTRRQMRQLAAKLDGWRPVKPYPGDFRDGICESYVDLLLRMCPSDRTLLALRRVFEEEEAKLSGQSGDGGTQA